MRIYLCSGKAAMSQQVFYGLYIGPVVEQVSSECMPEHMGALFFERRCFAKVFCYCPVDVSCIEWYSCF